MSSVTADATGLPPSINALKFPFGTPSVHMAALLKLPAPPVHVVFVAAGGGAPAGLKKEEVSRGPVRKRENPGEPARKAGVSSCASGITGIKNVRAETKSARNKCVAFTDVGSPD
jgi:hypothetical protein